MPVSMPRAKRSNPVYARKLGWDRRRQQIVHRFRTDGDLPAGQGMPGVEEFIWGIAKWQGNNGLQDDGIIGPNTWRKLKPLVRFSSDSASESTPPMSVEPIDDRVYDAINLFKYSPTAQGRANMGGGASYQARYNRLSTEVLAKLWSLWSAKEIGFSPMGNVGSSLARRVGYDIRVNNRLEPDYDNYSDPAEQGKLAGAACNMVHEAVHLVRRRTIPEEEMLCRTLQLYFYKDLRRGRSYTTRVTGTRLTAQFKPTTPFYNHWQHGLNRLASHDLIDSVIHIDSYRRSLERRDTADFISRSLDWWGALDNRWRSTRGYYLRSLAAQTRHDRNDYAEQMLKILESLSRGAWAVAKSCAGNMQKIGKGLRAGCQTHGDAFERRVQRVQRKLGEDFGV